MIGDSAEENDVPHQEQGSTRLSRDLIISVARHIAVEQGTSKLSLRRLGSELQVDHTALYRHFRSKSELLDAIADSLLEQRAELPDAPWQTQMRVGMRHAVRRYDIHPELAQVMAMRPSSSDASARLMDVAREVLARAGLCGAQAEALIPVVEAWGVAFGLYGSVTRYEARENGDSAEIDEFNRTLDIALDMFIVSIEQFRRFHHGREG